MGIPKIEGLKEAWVWLGGGLGNYKVIQRIMNLKWRVDKNERHLTGGILFPYTER